MKSVIWLASGLLVALLLVSGVVAGSNLINRDNFFLAQDIEFIGRASHRVFGQVNQSLSQQVTFLNNSVAVTSTGSVITNWFGSIIDWFRHLWPPKEMVSIITPANREQIRQEFLAELKSQGLINAEILSGNTSGTKYGIMVAPSTGSTTRDEWLKKNLSQMFADQVNLKFDQSGMSGVVTPVFKDGRQGGDYVFVLTPLR